MKNRKREIRTSGSVRDEDGQHPHLLGQLRQVWNFKIPHDAKGAARASMPMVPRASGLSDGVTKFVTKFSSRGTKWHRPKGRRHLQKRCHGGEDRCPTFPLVWVTKILWIGRK